MKSNHHQVTKNTSPAIKREQAKKLASEAGNPVSSGQVPHGLLPFDPDEDHPSCLCLYDRSPGSGGVVSQIPLNSAEFEMLLMATISDDNPIEMFVADAIREKLRSSRDEASSHADAGTSPEDSSPVKTESPMSPEDLAGYSAMRQNKLRSPLNLCSIGLEMIGHGDNPDSRLAEYLAGILRAFAADLWTHVISGLDDREAAYFGEVIALANEVADYYAVLDRGEKGTSASRPFPRSFYLPGFAKYQILETPEDVLFHLADSLNRHRDAIRGRILEPSQDRAGRLELVEALVIAQAVMDRAGGDAEIENCERAHTYPRLVRLSWKIKAEYHAAKLREQVATLEADIASDRAMKQRRAA